MRIKKNTRFEDSFVSYALLMLGCLNFQAHGSVILLCYFVFEIVRSKVRIQLDKESIVYFLLMASILISSLVYYGMEDCIKSINYCLAYVVGVNGYYKAVDRSKYIKRNMAAIMVGYSVHIALTYFFNYNLEQRSIRSLYSVWTENTVAVTLIGLLTSVIIAYSFYAFFCQKNRCIKSITALALVIAIITNANTATRTPFVLLALSYLILGTLYVFEQRVRKQLKIWIILVVLFAGLGICYYADFLGMRTNLEASNIFLRFQNEGFETSRFDIILEYLKYSWIYPWGGGEIKSIINSYAHTIILEIADLYGIVSMVILCVIIVLCLRNICRLIRIRNRSEIDWLFLSMYIVLFIQMNLEPVITGYPILLWNYLFIHGMATVYLSDKRNVGRTKSHTNKG